jgi:uncharacterized protein YjdB
MAQYTVNIAAEDSYTILINVNGIAEAGRLEVFIDNTCFSLTVDPIEEWNYFELKDKDLPAGEHKLKLIWIGEGTIQIGDLRFNYQGDVDLTPTLSYDFEDPANLGKATDGDYDLEIFGDPTQIDGPKSTDKAVYVPQDAYFKVINPLGSAVTGKQLATFSMMWEYRVEGISNGYHCILQARENNDGDGTFFIRPSDAAIGFSGHFTSSPYVAEEGKWQRVIFSFNDGVATIFVDGKVGYTGNWDVKLGDYFWLFLDNDGEDLPMECARYAFWADVALSQSNLKQMGIDGGITTSESTTLTWNIGSPVAEDVVATLSENTLTISGTGNYYDTPWYDFNNSIKRVIIGEGVSNFTGVNDLINLIDVSISSTVQVIYPNFRGCTSLESINVDPANSAYCSVDGVLYSKDMTQLIATPNLSGTFDIPAGVQRILYLAFNNAQNLNTINITDMVTTIDNFAFYGCTSLDAINVDPANSAYCSVDGVLYSKDMTRLIVTPNLSGTFVIPAGVLSMDMNAFSNAQNLNVVSISNTVININNAFSDCYSLTSVISLNPTPPVMNGWFANHSNITLKVPDCALEAYQNAELWQYFGAIESDASLPCEYPIYNISWNFGSPVAEDVVATFDGNTITISGSGAMVDDSDIDHIPWAHIRENIKKVIIEDGVTNIGRAAFYNCNNLTEVSIPNTVTTIGHNAFTSCFNLTEINIPNSVTTIGESAFGGCRITEIILPESIVKIWENVFSSLKIVTSLNPTPPTIGLGTFNWCNPPSMTLKVPACALEAYQNAQYWQDFGTIEAIGTCQASSISLDRTSATIVEGKTLQLTATVLQAADPTVVWTSSNPAVATVDNSGLVSAVAAGTATITAAAAGLTAECEVTVVEQTVSEPVVNVSDITLDAEFLTVIIGETAQLTATVEPADAADKSVSWKSSDEGIATVSQTGLVSAIAEGYATITASAGDHSASCGITVKQLPAVVAEQDEEAQTDASGLVALSLDIPQNENFEGVITVFTPEGISVNADLTSLADDLKGGYALDIASHAGGWESTYYTLEISPSALRSSSAGDYRQIVNIVYDIAPTVAEGDYEIFIDADLLFSSSLHVYETGLPVPIRVVRSTNEPQAIRPLGNDVAAYVHNGLLYVTSPTAETIRIYSLVGDLMQTVEKQPGATIIPLRNATENSILIVRGASGWTQKTIR